MRSNNAILAPMPDSSLEPRRFWKGWLISVFLHGTLLVACYLGFDRQGTPEGSGETFRDVGLYSKGDDPLADKTKSGETKEIESTETAESQEDANTPDESNSLLREFPMEQAEGPAVPLTLPSSNSIGVGPGPSSELMKTPGTRSGTGMTGHGPKTISGGGGSGIRFGKSAGTSFFQISAQGNQFAYVVDSSGSMDDGIGGTTPISVAKAELMASLERLDSTKRFQLFFYNADVFLMENGRQQIFFATDINRTLARQFLSQQQPNSGTQHKPALTMALRSGPDVLFFLTDGEEPELSASDLKDLKKLNRKPTQIHVIQFGRGPKLGGANWLEQMAQENSGSYRYKDIKEFKNP